MDSEGYYPDSVVAADAAGKKPPRKPRPSEIAAKKAKAAKTKKKVRKTDKRQNASAKKAHRAAKPKVVKTKRKSGKVKVPPVLVNRSERLDFRLSKSEKRMVLAKVRKLKRTITSIFIEALQGVG